jgi:diguanylate cyclase (GGDEF)-like protein
MNATTTIRIGEFDRFRRAYAEVLDRRRVEVESALGALAARPADPLARRLASGLLQQMESSSAPWGFAAVGRAAASLGRLVRDLPGGGDAAWQILRAESPLHLQELRRALGRRPETQERAERRLLFLVEPPGGPSGELGGLLRRYGYEVRTFGSAASAREALAGARPIAVLLDLPYHEDASGRSPALDSLEVLRRAGLPLLLVTDGAGVDLRIHALRAGADGLFARTGDAGALLDRLERMTAGATPDPYRVLVVDDDPVAGELQVSALRRAGMRAVQVVHPFGVMGPLRDLAPDLILLDMDLGPCSGRELAAALRQQDEFAGTPIVFLSSVGEIDRQLEARSVGAEDFLVKPIAPARLVAEVSLRAGRARSLRAHLLRDGQTGLLNPAAYAAQLRLEVERARRQARPLACARIQLDGVQALGAAADPVVRDFARLVRHRLRRTDLAARLGPDAVGLALPDCDGAEAVRVVEGLVAGFAEIRRGAPEGSPRITLRAGAAAFPDYPEASLLADAAEKALLRAGRNGDAGRPVLARA